MNDALFLHLAMIALGLGAVIWGLPAAYRLGKPWDALAALLVPAGVIIALLGTLLSVVPRFFKG